MAKRALQEQVVEAGKRKPPARVTRSRKDALVEVKAKAAFEMPTQFEYQQALCAEAQAKQFAKLAKLSMVKDAHAIASDAERQPSLRMEAMRMVLAIDESIPENGGGEQFTADQVIAALLKLGSIHHERFAEPTPPMLQDKGSGNGAA